MITATGVVTPRSSLSGKRVVVAAVPAAVAVDGVVKVSPARPGNVPLVAGPLLRRDVLAVIATTHVARPPTEAPQPVVDVTAGLRSNRLNPVVAVASVAA